MNTQRAKEIVESPVITTVTHEGVPIYIQHVDETTKMARIYPLSQPEHEKDVPLDSLVES